MTPPAQATTAPCVSVELPLPPRTLGKGASHHWRTVRRDYGEYKMFASLSLWTMLELPGMRAVVGLPWDAATMDIEWRFAGIQPDDDNVTIRCACFRDAAAAAGLVTNDRFIQVGAVTFVRVPRAEQCCVLTFTRIERAARPDAAGSDEEGAA